MYAADDNNEQVDGLPAQLTVTSPAPNATVGQPYSFSPQLTGGTAPFSWSVVSGQLPAGLSLNPATGTVSGTPTATGSSTVTIQVVDSGQPQLRNYSSYSFTVQPGQPEASIQPSSLDFGTQTMFRGYPAKSVTLSNAGHTPMSVTAVGIAGTDASDFALANDGCSGKTLAPKATCRIQVKFVPWEIVDVGPKTATLTFTDDGCSRQSTDGTAERHLAVSAYRRGQPGARAFPRSAELPSHDCRPPSDAANFDRQEHRPEGAAREGGSAHRTKPPAVQARR